MPIEQRKLDFLGKKTNFTSTEYINEWNKKQPNKRKKTVTYNGAYREKVFVFCGLPFKTRVEWLKNHFVWNVDHNMHKTIHEMPE